MLEEAHYYFQKAADVLNLPDRIREILWTPIRVVKVDLVVDDDPMVRAFFFKSLCS